MDDEALLTVKEVATRLRVVPQTVRQWVRAGKLDGFRLGERKPGWRIRARSVDRFVASQQR